MAYSGVDALFSWDDKGKWKEASEYWGVADIKRQYDKGGGGAAGLDRVGGYLAAGYFTDRFVPKVGHVGKAASWAVETRAIRLRELARLHRSELPPHQWGSKRSKAEYRAHLEAASKAEAAANRMDALNTDLVEAMAGTRPGRWVVRLHDSVIKAAVERAKVLRIAAEMQRSIDNFENHRPPGRPGERASRRPDRSDRLNLEAHALEALARGDLGPALQTILKSLEPSPADTAPADKRAEAEQAAERRRLAAEASERIEEMRKP
jgi:hypothetical protein